MVEWYFINRFWDFMSPQACDYPSVFIVCLTVIQKVAELDRHKCLDDQAPGAFRWELKEFAIEVLYVKCSIQTNVAMKR